MTMTEKQRKRAMARKGERLVRLAYDLEAEAAAFRGVDDAAAGAMKEASSLLGKSGRRLLDRAAEG